MYELISESQTYKKKEKSKERNINTTEVKKDRSKRWNIKGVATEVGSE